MIGWGCQNDKCALPKRQVCDAKTTSVWCQNDKCVERSMREDIGPKRQVRDAKTTSAWRQNNKCVAPKRSMTAAKITYTLWLNGMSYAGNLAEIKSHGLIIKFSCDVIGNARDPITHGKMNGRLREGIQRPRIRPLINSRTVGIEPDKILIYSISNPTKTAYTQK